MAERWWDTLENNQMAQFKASTAKAQYEEHYWNSLKSGANSSPTDQYASQFLSSWGGAMKTVEGMYGSASEALKNITAGISGGGPGSLSDLTNTMTQSYKEYQAEYAPMAKEFLTGARDTMRQKSAISKDLQAQSKPDYEGVTGRAYTDTMVQAEQQNAEAARKMMSYGLDPSGGQFGALTRRGAVDTAGMAVQAMNTARTAEKNRSTALSKDLMSLLNPSESANIGLGLTSQGNQLLTSAGNLKTAQVSALGNVASAYGNLAGGYAQNVAGPMGQLAGYYLGKSGGAVNPSTVSVITQPGSVQSGANYLGRPELATGGTKAMLEAGAFQNVPKGAIAQPSLRM